MTTRHKQRPAAYALDDPHVVVTESIEPPPGTGGDLLAADESGTPATPATTLPAQRRFRWTRVFFAATGGLIALALGLAVSNLIEDLFVRSEALGWTGVALAGALVLAAVAIVVREARGLMRLSAIEGIHQRAAQAIETDERAAGLAVVQDLLRLTRSSPMLARGRAAVTAHLGDIIDGADLVRLAERHLLTRLDEEAVKLVGTAAKRVSVVTAISPRALVDVLFVLIIAVNLMRSLAYLYGGRPGALGLIRLIKLCVAHMTLTGGMAASDSIVQQALGHDILARISTKLGEGALNGLLTARLGLAAIDVVRPLPFIALPRPALGDLASDLVRQGRNALTK